MFTTKIKGGALQYAMFIAVVIAVLVSVFIAVTHLSNVYDIKNHQAINNLNKLDLAVDYAANEFFEYNIKKPVPLFNQTNVTESLTVEKKKWGLFDLTIAAIDNKFSKQDKLALLGGSRKKNQRKTLLMVEHNRPLILVGDTRIEGDVMISKQGVKAGNVSGQFYNGSRFIYGAVSPSPLALPELAYQDTYQWVYNDENVDYFGLYERDSINHSFKKKTKYFRSNQFINLANISLKGNIIICSDIAINVSKSASLEDVILAAPKIVFETGFVGRVQAIAKDSIYLKKNAKLKYPSALYIDQKHVVNTAKNKQMKVVLEEGALLEGMVVVLEQQQRKGFVPQLEIQKDAMVLGEVYCDANIALRGKIKGTVYADNFILNEAGAIYQNHLLNAQISNTELPINFSGITFKNEKQTIAKWMY